MNHLKLMQGLRAGLLALLSQPRHVFGPRPVRAPTHKPPPAKEHHG